MAAAGLPAAGAPPTWKLLLVLLLHLCQPAHSDGDTDLLYFSYMGTAQAEDLSTVTQPPVIYPTLLSADDSPFSRVDLPFPFAFLGRRVRMLFASPNGGLSLSPTQPCPPYNIFGTSFCSFASSYYSTLGWLADLNPSASPNGNITTYFGATFLTLHYTRIRLYNSSGSSSFRISLFADHHISISYDSIAPLQGI
jgi:hypothetical protein